MGNKQNKPNKMTIPSNSSELHNYTSIDSKKPKATFINPDNNTCIIVDKSNDINIYYFSQTQNEFIKKTTHNADTKIEDVIYDPFHQTLIYWNKLTFHQFTYSINDDDNEIKITYIDNEDRSLNTAMIQTELIKDNKIVNASIFYQGKILLFVLDIKSIIAMKWNELNKKYEFIKQYKIDECQNIIGAGFHDKRAKMVLLKLLDNHYYLNIYSIGQMLRCIDSDDDEMKIESMDKPKLLLTRLVYQNPHNATTIISQFLQILNDINSKYKNTVNKHLVNTQKKYNGVSYIISTHFGVNQDNHCKLIFSGHGDKILYESGDGGQMLHKKHFGNKTGHAQKKVSGWMNDYGGTHLIDVNTGNSLWSTGESSTDKGIAWTLNDYLIVFKESMLNRCSFNMEGFESETMIAECIYNNVITTYDTLDGFSWDSCLLIAVYRGAKDRWYREITLCKYKVPVKSSKSKEDDKSLEIDSGLLSKPINVYNGNNTDKWFIFTTMNVNTNVYTTHFYESQVIGKKAFGDDDILIEYKKNNALICRNLTSPNDIFGEYFIKAQNEWGKMPDIFKYKKWNTVDMIKWIYHLDNGRYKKYLNGLLSGFELNAIDTGGDLADLGVAELREEPFNITESRDRRDLSRHFKSLKFGFKK